MSNYDEFFGTQIQRLKEEGRYRIFAEIERQVGSFPCAIDHKTNRQVTIWCSNDYLGMGQNPLVIEAMRQAVGTYGAGSGGTRNISGTTDLHVALEQELADLHSKEAALMFTSGYVCNEACLSTLGSALPDCVIFSDQKNHASMIHGIRFSGAQKEIFQHNNVQDLEGLLKKYPRAQPKIIAFESVYSMDGTIAPVEEIVCLAQQYNALTYIDEVHGVGLYGARGGGVVQQLGLCEKVDMIQGTFGKAIGVVGGYIAASKTIIDFIRSHAPGFIFTTSLPPMIVAGVLASIRHLKKSSAERKIHQLRVQQLKESLEAAGVPYMPTDSHIVPIMVGDSVLCKKITDRLLEEFHIYIQPINYPTVPRGTERLRLAPSPLHTVEMIQELTSALSIIWAETGLNRSEILDKVS